MNGTRASLGVFLSLSAGKGAVGDDHRDHRGVVGDATGEGLAGVTVTLTHVGIRISPSYRTSIEDGSDPASTWLTRALDIGARMDFESP
jgi:hypothetical protein